MPIYEYHCLHCKSSIDILQKISDAPITLCAKCGKDMLEKQLSAPSFHLKGSGWYATDFKDKKNNHEKNPPADEKPATPKLPTKKED